MNRVIRNCVYICAALPTWVAGNLAFGQSSPAYPERPVRMIVPYAPGGGSDYVGRALQPALTEELGQQVIIDNRDGANGNIGGELAAAAPPTGYTILLGNNSAMAGNTVLTPKTAVQPLTALIPVTEVADAPSLMIANPGFAPKTLKEFVDYAKANPGKVNYGSAGAGSVNWFEMESFKRQVGIDIVHVPYKGGAGPAMAGLLANDTQVMFTTLSGGLNLVKQGRLKALAVASSSRVPVLPDVMTMTEGGYKSGAGSWQGIFVPKGTPPAVVQRLFTALTRVVNRPDVKKRLADGGVVGVTSASPAAFFEFVKSEINRFNVILKDSGMTIN